MYKENYPEMLISRYSWQPSLFLSCWGLNVLDCSGVCIEPRYTRSPYRHCGIENNKIWRRALNLYRYCYHYWQYCGYEFDLSTWNGDVCGSGSGFSPWCGPQIWIQILGSNPWKSAQIGSYSIHFGLASANWCGFRSGFFYADPDADPGYQNDADPGGSGSTTIITGPKTNRYRYPVSRECKLSRLKPLNIANWSDPNADLDFFLMRMRIQVSRSIRIRMRIHNNNYWSQK